MSNKKKILFIINPISGTGKQKVVEGLIDEYLNSGLFDSKVEYTQRVGHATEIASEAVGNGFDIVVAVGGDGSVNETGKALIGTGVSMGIIPTGSGNGLARHLGIPMDLPAAMKKLNQGAEKAIDTGLINDQVFLGTAGVGFDAHIGKKFDEAPTRGFWTYFKLSVKEYFKYSNKKYHLTIDGKQVNKDAFIICFGNSSQWGNDAFISPNSVIDDGKIRVVIIRKMPFVVLPGFALKLFKKRLDSSAYFQEYVAEKVSVVRDGKLAHLDGEPVILSGNLSVEIRPKSLNVWC